MGVGADHQCSVVLIVSRLLFCRTEMRDAAISGEGGEESEIL